MTDEKQPEAKEGELLDGLEAENLEAENPEAGVLDPIGDVTDGEGATAVETEDEIEAAEDELETELVADPDLEDGNGSGEKK
jgi:hypothetical protein